MPLQAAREYDRIALRIKGAGADLNFPEEHGIGVVLAAVAPSSATADFGAAGISIGAGATVVTARRVSDARLAATDAMPPLVSGAPSPEGTVPPADFNAATMQRLAATGANMMGHHIREQAMLHGGSAAAVAASLTDNGAERQTAAIVAPAAEPAQFMKRRRTGQGEQGESGESGRGGARHAPRSTSDSVVDTSASDGDVEHWRRRAQAAEADAAAARAELQRLIQTAGDVATLRCALAAATARAEVAEAQLAARDGAGATT